jgi:hypothetical protein
MLGITGDTLRIFLIARATSQRKLSPYFRTGPQARFRTIQVRPKDLPLRL